MVDALLDSGGVFLQDEPGRNATYPYQGSTVKNARSISSTPSAQEEEIVVQGYVLASSEIAPGRSQWVIRLILPPGAETPHWTRHDATTMYVESGMLQFTGVTGNGLLTRGIQPVERSLTVTGIPVNLLPGDTVTVNRGIQHSIFNPVDQPTAIIVTTIGPGNTIPFDGLWTAEGYPFIIQP
jgi:mannose-6-phosphate isomerase-like protein (cupin superfamily)